MSPELLTKGMYHLSTKKNKKQKTNPTWQTNNFLIWAVIWADLFFLKIISYSFSHQPFEFYLRTEIKCSHLSTWGNDVPDSHRKRATVVFLCRDGTDPERKMKSAVKWPITISSNRLLGSSLSTNIRTAKEMLKIISWIKRDLKSSKGKIPVSLNGFWTW